MSAPFPVSPELRAWVLATHLGGQDALAVMALLQAHGYEAQASRSIVAQVLGLPPGAPPSGAAQDGLRTRHPLAPFAHAGDRRVRVTLATESPQLRVLDGMLDPDECDGLIALARPRTARVLTVDTQGRQQVDPRRTSAGMFFRIGEEPLVARIEARIASLLDIPVSHGEGLQVLHYLPGQEYRPHHDWFDPGQPGYSAITAHGGQRIATVLMYLNTPEAGGGTAFPALGLTVAAQRGSAVYFAYEGGDVASLHAGLAVERGEKWIATKWLREQPFAPMRAR